MKSSIGKKAGIVLSGLCLLAGSAQAAGDVETIRQALLGAGVGAFSAGASGGKAGKGALIGAGTQVIGTALMALLTESPSRAAVPVYTQPVYSQPVYSQPVYTAPQPQVQVRPVRRVTYQPVYTTTYEVDTLPAAPVSAAPQPAYTFGRTEDPNKRILRQGLMGAGVGAISAEVSGGKAGTGALVGAGSNVIGGALLELLTNS